MTFHTLKEKRLHRDIPMGSWGTQDGGENTMLVTFVIVMNAKWEVPKDLSRRMQKYKVKVRAGTTF